MSSDDETLRAIESEFRRLGLRADELPGGGLAVQDSNAFLRLLLERQGQTALGWINLSALSATPGSRCTAPGSSKEPARSTR